MQCIAQTAPITSTQLPALGPSAALCAECAVVAGVARRFTVTELARTARVGKRALEYDGEPPRADANG